MARAREAAAWRNYPRGAPPSMRSEERRSCRQHRCESRSDMRAVFLAKVDMDGVLDD